MIYTPLLDVILGGGRDKLGCPGSGITTGWPPGISICWPGWITAGLTWIAPGFGFAAKLYID